MSSSSSVIHLPYVSYKHLKRHQSDTSALNLSLHTPLLASISSSPSPSSASSSPPCSPFSFTSSSLLSSAPSSSITSQSTNLYILSIDWDTSLALLKNYSPHTCIPSNLELLRLFELNINPKKNPIAYRLKLELVLAYRQTCRLCRVRMLPQPPRPSQPETI